MRSPPTKPTHGRPPERKCRGAACLHVPVPLTAGIMEIMQALQADELAACDHSAIVRHYEKLAKVEVRK